MNTFALAAADGASLAAYQWLPPTQPRAVVQVVHGMAEHALRYDELARALNGANIAVYGHDLRGHGRTAREAVDLGYFGEGIGWDDCLADLGLVRSRIAEDFPSLPVFLLGHSMGSFLAQQFAVENRGSFSGLILSGSYLESRGLARAGQLLARIERLRLGARGRSALIRRLTFGAFNRRFAPSRTPFDWLSRDTGEVDRYLADPRCGFEPSVQIWIELLGALAAGLPVPGRGLPVLLVVGEHDPVCGPDPSATRLAEKFRRAGLDRLSHRIYPEARHELFHETNRAAVLADVVAWLDQVLAVR